LILIHGQPTVSAGGVDLTGIDLTYYEDFYLYVLKEGNELLEENLLAWGEVYYTSDSDSANYSSNGSILYVYDPDFNICTFDNGSYDFIIVGYYDTDGDFETDDDQSQVFGDRVTYTVTTGY
jgi:hypothetical protein